MRIAAVLFLLVCGFWWQTSLAATLKVQITDELEVFAQPDLKSKIIETVPAGQYITMKTDKVVGSGGIGIFYKIKTQKGRIGYVVDSDLPTSSDNLPKPVAPAPPPRPREPSPQPAPAQVASRSMASDSAWGVSVGAANFTEKFEEEKKSATQIFFGLRWLGRAGSFWGARPDMGLLISPNAPKFLASAGASGKTSGFILLGDFSLLYDVLAGKSFSFYMGGGPLLGYSKYSTNYNGSPKDGSSFKFGGVADAGFALDFTTGLARLDIRYFIESSAYLGGFLTLQLYL